MKNITNNISFEELSCQLLFPKLTVDSYFESATYRKEVIELVDTGVGGFCIFKGDVESVAKMISELQKRAKVPLLFAADFENGLNMRLIDGTSFPHAMALGRISDEYTYKISKTIAQESKMVGVNWVLAPVCDINSNKDNPVINIRAFGSDSNIVEKYTCAYIKGLQEEKVIGCAKHFPGHGDTSKDSHIELPVINKTLYQLQQLELLPFIKAIESDVKSIMVGHLAIPSIDNTKLPASLSKQIITELLRIKLGYKGLIVTDALDMKAITEYYDTCKICELALYAGNNVLLMPKNPKEAAEYLKSIKNQALVEHLNDSIEKILALKKWCGLSSDSIKFYKPDKRVFFSNEKLALDAALKATVVSGAKDLIPLNEDSIISGLAVIDDEDIDQATLFFKLLAQAIDNDCDFGFIDENITLEDIISLKKDLHNSDTIIIAFFNKGKSFKGKINPEQAFLDMLDKLCEGKKRINVLFGNPYLKDSIKSDSLLLTYSDSIPSIASAIIKLSGRNEEALIQ